MKNNLWRILVTLFISALLALGGIIPAYADYYSRWRSPTDYPTPPAYGSRIYTRTQWMRFYTNYYDNDQPRTGQYAVPIGAYYGDVFDDPTANNPDTGWTAIEKKPGEPPASTTAIPGDVSGWLEGYLGLNPNLCDSNYWLCSPAFLKDQVQWVQVGSQKYIVHTSWPVSNDPQGSNQKTDVQLFVGTALPDGSKPNLTPKQDTPTNPLCIKNGLDIFEAGATNDGIVDPTKQAPKYRYVWCGLASSDYSGDNPPCGDINLTQQAAVNAVGTVFDNPPGPQSNYMTSGYVTASFPYNIFVTGVSQYSGNNYLWYVVNQTPLYLHNITVRVYTHGLNTGNWNLAATYGNIDMPPAMANGMLKTPSGETALCYTSKNAVMIQSSGSWSVASPASSTPVPPPQEPFNVVVTADVDLRANGTPMIAPVCEKGMYATYWNGATPQGVPDGETHEFGSFSGMAQSILGRTLDTGYNDNVGESSMQTPPSPSPTPVQGSDNLAAEPITFNDQNNPTQMTFTFKNDQPFPEGGTAEVRFYIQTGGGYLMEYGGGTAPDGGYLVHISKGGTGSVTVSSSVLPFKPGDTVFASVDATSTDGVNWTGQQFQGDSGKMYWEGGNPAQYDPTAYYDNYTAAVIPGTPPPFTPAPSDDELHPTTYPLLDKTITYKTITVPVYGWQEVDAVPPTPPKPRVRLVPND